MRRFAAVLSLFIFSVSFAILILPLAIACPVQDPVPLRGLYLKSDIVVVARVGAPEKWKLDDSEADPNSHFRTYRRSIPLKVEETIKGADTKDVSVTEERWRGVHEGNSGGETAQAVLPNTVKESDPEFESTFTDNKDRRLFFLRKNEESEGYSEVYRNHAFEHTQKELDVFISRLRELANIYSAAKPSKELIVEWLVSMAEDPVTRFEGAFELHRALEASGSEDDDEEENAAEQADDTVAVEAGSAEKSVPEIAPDITEVRVENLPLSPFVYRDYRGDSEFAKLLTAAQKERLVRAFINVRFNYEPVKDEDAEEDNEGDVEILNDADTELLGAVCKLGDRRVIDRLLAELPLVARYQTWQASEIMETLGSYFKDDKLKDLAEKYESVIWGSDDDLIIDLEKAYDKPEAPEAVEPGAGAANEDRPSLDVSSEVNVSQENAKAAARKIQMPQKTYGQRRAELFDRIMARCGELVMTAKK